MHREKLPDGQTGNRLLGEAIRNYFAHRPRLSELEFKRLVKQCRLSLLVGLSFLGLCLLMIELLLLNPAGTLPNFSCKNIGTDRAFDRNIR